MTSTHPALEGDLLWDYPAKTPRIVGLLAIAACFGIGVTLLRAAYLNDLWFVAGFGLAFLVVLTDFGHFLMHRLPARPRALSDWANHDGVVLDRERREHEENLPIRSATQRVIVVFLTGSYLGVVPWLVGDRMGVFPDLMHTAEQVLVAVVLMAATVAAWPKITSVSD